MKVFVIFGDHMVPLTCVHYALNLEWLLCFVA